MVSWPCTIGVTRVCGSRLSLPRRRTSSTRQSTSMLGDKLVVSRSERTKPPNEVPRTSPRCPTQSLTEVFCQVLPVHPPAQVRVHQLPPCAAKPLPVLGYLAPSLSNEIPRLQTEQTSSCCTSTRCCLHSGVSR